MTTEELDIITEEAEDIRGDEQTREMGLPEDTAYLDVGESSENGGQPETDEGTEDQEHDIAPEDEYLSPEEGEELGLPYDETDYVPNAETEPKPESEPDAAPEPEQESASEPDGITDIEAENEAIRQKIIERRKEKKRKARMRRARFWAILSVILFAAAAFAFSISGFFTVDSIEVDGNSHFTAEEIINIGHAVPGHNLIYDPGDKEIVDYLVQNPYIKSATVTRKFPSTLLITVVERSEACAFQYDDDYLVMDDEGILLKKTRTEPKLTMVTGLVVSKLKLGQTVGTQNQTMFSRLLKLIRTMKASDLYFVHIDMSSYEEDASVRAYIYDNLVVRAQYDQLAGNMKNGRLHKVIEKLFEDGVKRGTILLTDDGTISFEPGF